MKKTILSMLLAAAASVSAMAADTWSLQGTTFTVDTLFHNQVGPGTTSTSLWFRIQSMVMRCVCSMPQWT